MSKFIKVYEDYHDEQSVQERIINFSCFTVLLFCNNPKASGKVLLSFCRGNQGDVNLRVGLHKYVTALSHKWNQENFC